MSALAAPESFGQPAEVPIDLATVVCACLLHPIRSTGAELSEPDIDLQPGCNACVELILRCEYRFAFCHRGHGMLVRPDSDIPFYCHVHAAELEWT